jgi:hypothetical protein
MTSTDEGEEVEIGTGAKGKQGELIVLGELLRRKYQVYTPMVDSGIDCLVDIGEGNYKEIQIKYRENEPIFQARRFKPRDNFYFVCYLKTLHGDDFWIVPSKIFEQRAHPTKVRNHDYLQLRIGREGSEAYASFREYRQNFDVLLTGASKEIRKLVEQASKRVEGPHLKQPDYEREVLELLADETAPLPALVIIKELEQRMQARFSRADLAPTKGTKGKSNRKRWEVTARFALYQGLKRKGLIAAEGKNKWVISPKGRALIGKSS